MIAFRVFTARFSAAALAILLTSCTTPAAVSQFCASAAVTLATTQTVLGDMKQSCLRRVASDTDIGSFSPPPAEDEGCTAIGKSGDSAIATAKVLASYFSAINSLASFGAAKAGTDAQALITQASGAAGASAATQTALGSIASFLTAAATSGYQARALEKDLPAVSGNINNVVKALTTIVEQDYEGQILKEEERKLAFHYQKFAKNKSPEVQLTLDGRWQADEQALVARRTAAGNLVIALQALGKGFADLAANARKLNAKEVPGLLGPYVAQIQTLIPQVQKAF